MLMEELGGINANKVIVFDTRHGICECYEDRPRTN